MSFLLFLSTVILPDNFVIEQNKRLVFSLHEIWQYLQHTDLQRTLHELQSEIRSLSDQQVSLCAHSSHSSQEFIYLLDLNSSISFTMFQLKISEFWFLAAGTGT